jgi:hypothetical protein
MGGRQHVQTAIRHRLPLPPHRRHLSTVEHVRGVRRPGKVLIQIAAMPTAAGTSGPPAPSPGCLAATAGPARPSPSGWAANYATAAGSSTPLASDSTTATPTCRSASAASLPPDVLPAAGLPEGRPASAIDASQHLHPVPGHRALSAGPPASTGGARSAQLGTGIGYRTNPAGVSSQHPGRRHSRPDRLSVGPSFGPRPGPARLARHRRRVRH